ncbi:putative membrane protein [Desulfoluna spongiiphila]|uniref:Putative membrane protein n=2 Tax=Desulfoluna spongiiphila TaxID=419481 RepID=A0A1G5FFD6_9BACT|nr:putative membrane protein [Desulfoluna spongiiphila]
MTSMKKATHLFTDDEIRTIESAIGEVEKTTSAEVVPVVASASGRYDRAEDLFGFLFSLLVLGCTWGWLHGMAPAADAWGESPAFGLPLAAVLVVLAVSFFIGMALASHFPILRLPLIARREMQEEVERRARETFQRLKVRKTEHATGILIYVSLYEHMVHVVGDDTINATLSQQDWTVLCDIIISGFKEGRPEKGMTKGILRCGELLARHFPIQPGDTNELVDTLHLID